MKNLIDDTYCPLCGNLECHADNDGWCLAHGWDCGDFHQYLNETSEPLVDIIHLQGDDYETAVDAANDQGGSTEAVVAYLAQFDYGDETDSVAEINGHTKFVELERLQHQLHEADHGGLHYWLQVDHGLRFYGLYRRPL
ncbi:hypothetical protein [Arthrobacter castelli]|uniref:hypothetical protein n=1 Tax=Arthrobacter castelli TaxID=271431 RepID=UPI000479687A|nr:hypothetical protein [Arthrobacter castelli]